jgi:hypothetical protein
VGHLRQRVLGLRLRGLQRRDPLGGVRLQLSPRFLALALQLGAKLRFGLAPQPLALPLDALGDLGLDTVGEFSLGRWRARRRLGGEVLADLALGLTAHCLGLAAQPLGGSGAGLRLATPSLLLGIGSPALRLLELGAQLFQRRGGALLLALEVLFERQYLPGRALLGLAPGDLGRRTDPLLGVADLHVQVLQLGGLSLIGVDRSLRGGDGLGRIGGRLGGGRCDRLALLRWRLAELASHGIDLILKHGQRPRLVAQRILVELVGAVHLEHHHPEVAALLLFALGERAQPFANCPLPHLRE